MKLQYKILLSIPLQIALYFGVPELLHESKLGGFYWTPSWDTIYTHKIFKEPSPQKVVFLGASYFGERYCAGPVLTPGAILEDGCMLSTILNEKKSEYPETKDFQFYQLTMGGTIANVHFYFLLHLLDLPKGSIKYIIYDGPRKFMYQLVEREYHALHLELVKKIAALPQEYKTQQMLQFEEHLQRQIKIDYASGAETPNTLRWHMFKKYVRNRRDWIFNFLSNIKLQLYSDANKTAMKQYVEQHQKQYGAFDKNTYDPVIIPLAESEYMKSEESFEFFDLLEELCRLKGIQLVIYYSPSRYYYSWEKKEPYNSKVHQPTIDRYQPRGVKFMDYRAMPFLIPRDTIDGIHPSMPMKLTIADRMLSDLRSYEQERKR